MQNITIARNNRLAIKWKGILEGCKATGCETFLLRDSQKRQCRRTSKRKYRNQNSSFENCSHQFRFIWRLAVASHLRMPKFFSLSRQNVDYCNRYRKLTRWKADFAALCVDGVHCFSCNCFLSLEKIASYRNISCQTTVYERRAISLVDLSRRGRELY